LFRVVSVAGTKTKPKNKDGMAFATVSLRVPLDEEGIEALSWLHQAEIDGDALDVKIEPTGAKRRAG
jgi:hypothetical protein